LCINSKLSLCYYVWKEKKETLERKREGVYSKLLFNLCKPFIVEIKQCVLYPLSVSKPPPVVSPTNTLVDSSCIAIVEESVSLAFNLVSLEVAFTFCYASVVHVDHRAGW